MTDTPKTMQLSPADWRQLLLLNVEQLHGYLSSVPPNTETGVSAMTDEIMAVVDAHVARGRDLLVAWRKSRLPGMAPARAQEAQQAVKTNGHVEPVKRRGGWPKGKPRKPKTVETQQ
jgi:hypothetical protein